MPNVESCLWSILDVSMHPGSVRSKRVVNSGVLAEARMSRFLTKGVTPQAGNGAGKNPRRSQWKDCTPEASSSVRDASKPGDLFFANGLVVSIVIIIAVSN